MQLDVVKPMHDEKSIADEVHIVLLVSKKRKKRLGMAILMDFLTRERMTSTWSFIRFTFVFRFGV